MSTPRLDANVSVRYLTDEPWEQAEFVAQLFQQIENGFLEVWLEDVALAEVIWVLSSFYRVPKDELVVRLPELLGPASIKARDKSVLRSALTQFRDRNVDFIDALMATQTVYGRGSHIYSFDRDFDRLPGVTRIEPE